ncbi:hypothetical protein BUALT_Bualt17G0108800 [Buddleja alternifolia]|uniref:H15 domain-containing protein n=1 Tax=Buddleja alternifolia TaxID=168488 RepID=A0AAV6WFF4_9LAMI|nr:hypothetical protein BUALT_Bualt17G0108800 [Buddleja alternifolia]
MDSQTLPSILKQPTRGKLVMEKFRGLVFKLAQAHPNAPLTPSLETDIRNHLDHFFSQYKTPDHPPYSAMIERALRELNEKGGTSEGSISQFLEKEYDGLPWAHSALLKHHLGKLCESGDIIMNRGKRYMLAGVKNSSLNLRSTSKSKPPLKRKSKLKWRREWVIKRNRLHKKQVMIRTRTNQRLKCDKIEKNQELKSTENGVNSQVEEDQAKELRSCDLKHQQECEQAEDNTPGIPRPGRPPGFENSTHFGVDCCKQEQGIVIGEKEKNSRKMKSNLLILEEQPGIETAEESSESNRALQKPRPWSMRLRSRLIDTKISVKDVKSGNVDDDPPKNVRRGRPFERKPVATNVDDKFAFVNHYETRREDLAAEAKRGATKTLRIARYSKRQRRGDPAKLQRS